MTDPTCTAFSGHTHLATGARTEVALAIRRRLDAEPQARILLFCDDSGKPFDLDLSGSDAEVVARHAPAARGRGRPKLGVTGREITLLPRHWDWLDAQQGGASRAVRLLIDKAMQADPKAGDRRRARDAAYHFLAAMAGNLPQFEEVSRALFAADMPRAFALMADWPADIVEHARRLAGQAA